MSIRALMTAEELFRYPAEHTRTELVRGQLLVHEPVGAPNASVLTELATLVNLHVRATTPALGRVFVGEPGFWIARDPDTVRAPDLAFVKRERFPDGRLSAGFLQGPPDFAVEIRSPSDRTGAVLQKVGDWLTAGTTLVWVIDPARDSAQVYHANGEITLVGADGVLAGAPVLPGLEIPLAALLDG